MSRLCERPGCSEAAAVAYGMRPEDLVFWLDVIPSDGNSPGGVLCRRHADSMVVPRNWTLDDLRDPELHLFRPPTIRRARVPRARRTTNVDPTGEQLRLAVLPPDPDDETPSVGAASEPTAVERAAETDDLPVADTDSPGAAGSQAADVDVADPDVADTGVADTEGAEADIADHVAEGEADRAVSGDVDVVADEVADAEPAAEDADGVVGPPEIAAVADPETPWMPDFDARSDLDGLLSARSPLLARAFRGDDRRR